MRRLEHLRLILEINILTNYITLLSLKFSLRAFNIRHYSRYAFAYLKGSAPAYLVKLKESRCLATLSSPAKQASLYNHPRYANRLLPNGAGAGGRGWL